MAEGNGRPAADRQAGSEEGEGGGDVPYVPGGERVDEGEQHLELAAAVGGEPCVHLDDHGVDDLAQARRRRGAAVLELPEQRDGTAPARPRRRPARHQRGCDRARGGRAARRHAEPDPPHPRPGPAPGARRDHGIPARARGRSLAPSPGGWPARESPHARVARDAAPCRRRAARVGMVGEWDRRGRDGTERLDAERGGREGRLAVGKGERRRETERRGSETRARGRNRNRGTRAWPGARPALFILPGFLRFRPPRSVIFCSRPGQASQPPPASASASAFRM